MQLTPQEVQLFRHNGFIKFPKRLPGEQVAALKEAALRDIGKSVEPVARDNGRIIRLSNLWGRGGIFQRTITSDEILDPLESLLGPNIEFLINRHNHFYLRDADSNHSLTLHRDCHHWSRPIVTVLLYLEESNLETGCTRVVPGTHLAAGFLSHRDADIERAYAQTIPLPMPPGGLLAIDGMLLHAAGINRSDRTRMSITLGFHSVDEFSFTPDPKCILVRGERIYGGNDHVR